ncbi:M15 family metallopeptidase [Pelagibacterium sp.]|uniref:M15 family metallopeptidase n=1 Tax=Pelagibacterium sp. TaxID=1967288 RepID=UPI003A94110E
MTYHLSSVSLGNLEGVHPDLVRVIKRAITITPIDFRVIEGTRSVDRQRELVRSGASQTMNSRHIPAANGHAHAVDVVPYVDTDGNGSKEVSWSWPHYYPLAKAIKDAAKLEGVVIEWGGDWKSFKDGPHWQLPWKQYPGSAPAVAYDQPITNRTDRQVATRDAAVIGTTGATAAAASVGDSIGPVVSTLTMQQHELSSGDWIRIAVAGVIVALTIIGIASKTGILPWGKRK